MKNYYLLIVTIIIVSCTKQKVQPQNNTNPTSSGFNCDKNSSVVSYSSNILPLFQNKCNNCHSTPGSGGINLDSYSFIKQTMLGGQIIPVVINTDTTSIIMPPPPRKHLDSCEIKMLNLWMAQGCLNN